MKVRVINYTGENKALFFWYQTSTLPAQNSENLLKFITQQGCSFASPDNPFIVLAFLKEVFL